MSLISGPQDDRDAAEPLLTNQPSSNLIVDFYTQQNTFLPYGGHGDTVDTQLSRTIYSPQHPSQDLIEMLNRNQQLSQVREERKHRDKWCEKHRHKIKLDPSHHRLSRDTHNLSGDAATGINTKTQCHVEPNISTDTNDSCIEALAEYSDKLSHNKIDSKNTSCEAVYTQDDSDDKTCLLNKERTSGSTELTLNVENLLT